MCIRDRYCQVLEHKWFLSERAKKDVGLEAAMKAYVKLRREQPMPALLRSENAPLVTVDGPSRPSGSTKTVPSA